MRRLVLLVPLVALAAACGGSSSKGQSHSLFAVSKAFSDAGLPFTTQQVYNPYVNGNAVFLPGKLNTTSLRTTIVALLSETGKYNGVGAWVFDSDAHAAAALKIVPLAKWLPSSTPEVTLHDGNVVVVAAGFTGAEKKKLDAALTAIKG